MKKVTGFVLIALLLCSLIPSEAVSGPSDLWKIDGLIQESLHVQAGPLTSSAPLRLQRAQLQEWASDQGCSLHLSHWARVFPCHLMLHELLGRFFAVFLPFFAIVCCLAMDFFYCVVCAGAPSRRATALIQPVCLCFPGKILIGFQRISMHIKFQCVNHCLPARWFPC